MGPVGGMVDAKARNQMLRMESDQGGWREDRVASSSPEERPI